MYFTYFFNSEPNNLLLYFTRIHKFIFFIFGINNNKAVNIKINGEALDLSKSYKTCVNSYMASGGDECEFMIALPKQSTTVLIRDAILAFINMQNTNKQSLVIEPIQRITH